MSVERDDGNISFARLSSGESLEDNLLRRDFTVNSLALSLPSLFDGVNFGESLSIIDVGGGLNDLLTHTLRPRKWKTLIENPLSLLRGLQLTKKNDFHFVSTVKGQINSGKIRSLSRSDRQFWETFLSFFQNSGNSEEKVHILEMSRALVEYSLGGKVVRLNSSSNEGYCSAMEAMNAFDRLTSPLSWARCEHFDRVSSIGFTYMREILSFLILCPQFYSVVGSDSDRSLSLRIGEGALNLGEVTTFHGGIFSSGNEFAQALSDRGCCDSKYLTNMSLILESILSLGSSGFPARPLSSVALSQCCASENSWAWSVGAIVLACSCEGVYLNQLYKEDPVSESREIWQGDDPSLRTVDRDSVFDKACSARIKTHLRELLFFS